MLFPTRSVFISLSLFLRRFQTRIARLSCFPRKSRTRSLLTEKNALSVAEKTVERTIRTTAVANSTSKGTARESTTFGSPDFFSLLKICAQFPEPLRFPPNIRLQFLCCKLFPSTAEHAQNQYPANLQEHKPPYT